MKRIKQHISKLRKKLRRWEYFYYVESSPEVDDHQYDEAMKELCELEKKWPHLLTDDSPSQKIGRNTKNTFEPILHKTPMLSLDNVFKDSELIEFDRKIRNKIDCNNITYCCELKIDGLAVNLLYEDGELIQASTRGDGSIGEDVSKNVKTIASIPTLLKGKKIPRGLLEVRGEIFILKNEFQKLNRSIKQKGGKEFTNARNAASGSLRHLDSKITATRPLKFFCHSIGLVEEKNIFPNSHLDRLVLLKEYGIPISTYMRRCINISEVIDFHRKIHNVRAMLEFNIDGIVIKVDSIKLQEKLGHSSRAPKWALAYKFQSERQITKVNNVEFHISRTGTITPIAYFEPVVISGVTIQSATLHNIREMKRLNIMINDKITVQRSGDVIPKIINVITEQRPENIKPVLPPSKCPSCKSNLEYIEDSGTLRCNMKLICPAQRKESLKHFISRKAMNIRGIGSKTIDQLVDLELITTPADLFQLNENILKKLHRVKLKLSNKFLRELERAKQTTFARFLFSLGIPKVGIEIAQNLAIQYRTIEKIIEADINSLMQVKCVGKIVAIHILNFFKEKNNINLITRLLSPEIGINWPNSQK